MLLGYKFLNNWIKNKEYIIDYMELFNEKLKEKYGEKIQKEFTKKVEELSVLLAIKYDNRMRNEIERSKIEIDKKIDKIIDNKSFVEEVTRQKKIITKEIKRIDETLNNKNMLQNEYERRNENLPLQEKIFSMRILSKMLIDERDNKIKKIEELNELLKPKKFVSYKKKLEDRQKILRLIDIKDIEQEIEKSLKEFQEIFLECYENKIKKAETKQEIIKLIYEFRYYCLLPFNQQKTINGVKELEKKIENVERKLITKAHEIKAIELFSKNEEIDYQILKLIFEVRVICLEDLNVKIIKEKNKYYMQLFDENVFEEKIEIKNAENINKNDLEIKLNKKVKIFN